MKKKRRKIRIIGMRQNVMQYKQVFDTINSENIQASLSSVKRIGLHFVKNWFYHKKIGSGCPKTTMKRDD